MSGMRFGVVLVLMAVAATALLWFLGYWIIAFAVGVAVLAIGTVVFLATRAGSASGSRRSHLVK